MTLLGSIPADSDSVLQGEVTIVWKFDSVRSLIRPIDQTANTAMIVSKMDQGEGMREDTWEKERLTIQVRHSLREF